MRAKPRTYVTVSIQITPQQKKLLEVMSEEDGDSSLSAVIRKILRDFAQDNTKAA